MSPARTVVVIDDEFYSRAALEDLLRRADTSVELRPGMDFQHAAQVTDWEGYDQVFLDLAQPLVGRPPDQTYGTDNEHLGCEIVRHIRSHCPRGGPAVIVVTTQQASFDNDYVRAWLHISGADGFVLRPSLAEQLPAILKQGRTFKREVEIREAFKYSEDGRLLRAKIGRFVDWVREDEVEKLPTGRAGEDRRQKTWARGAATGAPLGDTRKKDRAIRMFRHLTRILPSPKYENNETPGNDPRFPDTHRG